MTRWLRQSVVDYIDCNTTNQRGATPIHVERQNDANEGSLGANGPGLAVAVIAVILALSGAAFAAGGGLSGKQKKQVEKNAKKIRWQTWNPRCAGPQGPARPTGAKGDKGEPGPESKAGKGVAVSAIPSGNASECAEQGGALVKQEGAQTGVKVCNGAPGPEGFPWTDGGTLPGETETGCGLSIFVSSPLAPEPCLEEGEEFASPSFPYADPGSLKKRRS